LATVWKKKNERKKASKRIPKIHKTRLHSSFAVL